MSNPNISNRREQTQQLSEEMKINRQYMIFAQTHKEERSLTHKNSSDNISIAQSVQEGDDPREVVRRVPSNSSYLNKINHSGLNVKQALVATSEAAAKRKETNIYQLEH